MCLPLRESADRTFLLPSAPSDWDTVFAAPRLLPWFLPRVFTHLDTAADRPPGVTEDDAAAAAADATLAPSVEGAPENPAATALPSGSHL